jgi:hypothetical protein
MRAVRAGVPDMIINEEAFSRVVGINTSQNILSNHDAARRHL